MQLVTVVGEPGLGKSRLVWELGQEIDRRPELVTWRQGRCLPYGEGITFWALGEIVKAEAGILESDNPAEAHAKLEARRRGRRRRRGGACVVHGPACPSRRCAGGGCRRCPSGGVHGLAALPRGTRRAAAARARDRGPPLGGRCAARLRRRPPGLGGAGAAAGRRYSPARALREPPGVGRRTAQLDDGRALASLRRGDREAHRRTARTFRAACGDAGSAPRARRRKSALHGAVRADAGGARRRGDRRAGDRSGADLGAARHAGAPSEVARAGRRRRRQGLLDRRPRGDGRPGAQ